MGGAPITLSLDRGKDYTAIAMRQPPLILLHAVTRDRHDFTPFLPHLPAVRPMPVDLPGHGEAARAPRYTIADYAAGVVLPDEPAILYGHSLGGMVALRIAATHPGRVRALVLEDPPLFDSRQPRLDETPWADEFRKLKSILIGRGAGFTVADWKRAVAAWPSGHGTATIEAHGGADAVARRARQIAALDPAVLDDIVSHELHDGFEVRPSLVAAGCPVIVLVGNRSLGSGLSEADVQLLAGEPNVRIVRAPKTGHYIHEAEPELSARAVADALAG